MAKLKAGTIRIGIGGWTYAPWKGSFYPQGLPARRELEHAAAHLDTIEVNGTFYRSQSPATFAKWRDETPDRFVFALKGPRYTTNRRDLREAGDSVARFTEGGIAELGDKLGPINWQLAPTKKFDADEIEGFLALLPQEAGGIPLRHAIEARHESFACAAFIHIARRHGVAIILAGDSEYPQIADPTAGFVYARIMGTTKAKAGYQPKALDLWAGRASAWAEGREPEGLATAAEPARAAPRDVFLYVISGFKERNPLAAVALIERLRMS